MNSMFGGMSMGGAGVPQQQQQQTAPQNAFGFMNQAAPQ